MKYRFRFHPSVWVLLSFAMLISLAGVGLNIFNIIALEGYGAEKISFYVVILAPSAFFFVFSLSIALGSFYTVKNGHIYSRLGIIKSKIAIEDVLQFTHFKKSDKLVAYFKNGKYVVIVISPDHFDKFVAEVKTFGRHVVYLNGEENNAES